MSELFSRLLVLCESALIAAPISLFFLTAGSTVYFLPLIQRAEPLDAAIGCLVGLALVSAWVLLISFVRGGVRALRRRARGWWLLAASGVVVLAASLVSHILPPSAEYTQWWRFRGDFGFLATGLPLVVPLSHLILEAWLRGR